MAHPKSKNSSTATIGFGASVPVRKDLTADSRSIIANCECRIEGLHDAFTGEP